jgi:hypothetical protein
MTENYVSLADAILLGSAITEARATHLDHCALGMAGNAMGMIKAADWRLAPESETRYHQLIRRWPWLTRVYGDMDEYGRIYSCWNWIAFNFNIRVCPEVGEPTMTLEELCAEVRKMEAMYIHLQSSTLPIDTASELTNIALAEEERELICPGNSV